MKDAIGVIGGMGPLASQLFYKMITEHTAAECDQDHVPLLILSDVTMPDRTGAILDGKYDAPYNRLIRLFQYRLGSELTNPSFPTS